MYALCLSDRIEYLFLHTVRQKCDCFFVATHRADRLVVLSGHRRSLGILLAAFRTGGQDLKFILRSLDNSSVDYSVRKVWLNDESQPQNRAASVTVARYRDNQFYDEITLSEENAWTCEWEDTVDHVWFVREKVIPAGYTVACRQRQTQYLIINTFTGTDVQTETTTTATTLSTAETQDTAASASESSTVTTTAAVTTTAVTDKIPQTGQLWWPVPCLAGSGMLLLGLGFILRRKEEEE